MSKKTKKTKKTTVIPKKNATISKNTGLVDSKGNSFTMPNLSYGSNAYGVVNPTQKINTPIVKTNTTIIPKNTKNTGTKIYSKNSADNMVQDAYDKVTGARTSYGASLGLPDMLGGKRVVAPEDSAEGIASTFNYSLNAEDRAAQKASRDYLAGLREDAEMNLDPTQIYNQTLGRFQGQIDALNKVYNDQLNRARIEGAGRIESRQFSQGRSGQIGSGTGEAGINAVQDANRQVEYSIDAERNAAIGAIMSNVRNKAAEELKAKTEAKRAGADALLKYYDEAPARKEAKLNPIIAQLISSGIDPETIDTKTLNEIMKGTGASKEEILSAYKTTKETKDSETEKADLETRKLTAEITNAENKHDWDTAKDALDRALDQKRIDIAWYNAETARINSNKKKDEEEVLGDLASVNPSFAGESLPIGDDSKKGTKKGLEIAQELEDVGVTTEAIIKIQDLLGRGYSLKQIAQAHDMPADAFAVLNKYIVVE